MSDTENRSAQNSSSSPTRRHRKTEKIVNTHGIFKLYRLYFIAVRWFGVYPCEYDGTDKFEVRVSRHILVRLWWWMNLVYVAVYFAKVNILLGINHHTGYKYETLRNSHMFQLMFVYGVGLVSSLFFSQSAKMAEVATTMSMWLKLEKNISGIPETQEMTRKRHKFLKIQYGLYMGTLISSCFTLNGMGFGAPQFSVFLSSALIGFGRAANPSYRYYAVDSVWEAGAKGLAQFGEAYTGIIGWEVIGSFDVLISMMCRTVCHTIDKLKTMVEAEGVGVLQRTELYHSCRIFVTKMSDVFGRVLFVQELLNMGVSVLLFYGALKEREVIYLMAFFITNGIALTIRIYLLYLPMSNVYTKSLGFRTFVARKLMESKLEQRLHVSSASAHNSVPDLTTRKYLHQHERLLLEKKAAGFRYMVFRPWGFHRISTKSIMDYILAMFSYIVTVKNV